MPFFAVGQSAQEIDCFRSCTDEQLEAQLEPDQLWVEVPDEMRSDALEPLRKRFMLSADGKLSVEDREEGEMPRQRQQPPPPMP